MVGLVNPISERLVLTEIRLILSLRGEEDDMTRLVPETDADLTAKKEVLHMPGAVPNSNSIANAGVQPAEEPSAGKTPAAGVFGATGGSDSEAVLSNLAKKGAGAKRTSDPSAGSQADRRQEGETGTPTETDVSIGVSDSPLDVKKRNAGNQEKTKDDQGVQAEETMITGQETHSIFLSMLGLLLSEVSRNYLRIAGVGLKTFIEKAPQSPP
jgi:hypothetical protein